ncbi:MAG: hypothetical protein B6I20_06840 [Bacteroidetes bacterium 4572_117]|nr:MAG: hypothetical protein B6I20_06840 [Bacteroidetes bacterium 4572_117]
MLSENKLILTTDGSHTVLNSGIGETYHSENGAINESLHVFIQNGLSLINKTEINILEIGFGTGLNALLTYQFAAANNKNINYFTLEKFPLKKGLVKQLNYTEKLSVDNEFFLKLHDLGWDNESNISPNFRLIKRKSDLLDYNFNELKNIDLVFFDAFSPSKQPELWTKNIFDKIYNAMSVSGLLSTYSSAGVVKRALREVGFKVKRKPGPKGKFHMLNATKE